MFLECGDLSPLSLAIPLELPFSPGRLITQSNDNSSYFRLTIGVSPTRPHEPRTFAINVVFDPGESNRYNAEGR